VVVVKLWFHDERARAADLAAHVRSIPLGTMLDLSTPEGEAQLQQAGADLRCEFALIAMPSRYGIEL
jgi:hypothetical protein